MSRRQGQRVHPPCRNGNRFVAAPENRHGLTECQVEILRRIALDESIGLIAAEKGCHITAIYHHLKSIRTKLGLTSQVQLVHFAIKHGYVEVIDFSRGTDAATNNRTAATPADGGLLDSTPSAGQPSTPSARA